MLYRACARLVSLTSRSDTLLRVSVHSSAPQLVKKNTETTSTPTKDNTTIPRESYYPSGVEYFGHHAYSFYDAEIDMEKDRLKQVSAKMEKKPLGGK